MKFTRLQFRHYTIMVQCHRLKEYVFFAFAYLVDHSSNEDEIAQEYRETILLPNIY